MPKSKKDSQVSKEEIDSIFSKKNKKPVEQENKTKQVIDIKSESFFDTRGRHAKPIRYTTDGLPIYKAVDLGISKLDEKGDDVFLGPGCTEKCPFECDCCF